MARNRPVRDAIDKVRAGFALRPPPDLRERIQREFAFQMAQVLGKWTQSARTGGAHYRRSSLNPFALGGLRCANCAFWSPNETCAVVHGAIEANGLCKLWVIPAAKISVR